MHKLTVNTHKTRKCTVCKRIKALSIINFCRSIGRPYGFDYRCKECDQVRKNYHTPGRWGRKTEAQKKAYREWTRKWAKTKTAHIGSLVARYRKFDKLKGYETDLTKKFIEDFIYGKPCTYCEDTTKPIGCDRIRNDRGHTQNNVVPCCPDCNIFRKDSFSHEEMLIIGKSVKLVKEARLRRITGV